jgi:elongation factor G
MPSQNKPTTDRVVPLDKVRNIGIIAHIDAGKTTTTERILFETGKTHKLGNIDEGTTVTDWMAQERERGITIVSAAITTFWDLKTQGAVDPGSYRINIIDTPGHVDFTAEVERSLRVLDGAVMIFDGKMGVEAQSETVWHQADKYHVPRLCFVNKLNLIGGDFGMSLDSIRERLSPNIAPIWIPIGIEHDLKGIIDLVEMKAYTYDSVDSNELKTSDIPAELKDKAEKYRTQLIEKVAEFYDPTLEKYLDGQELEPRDIKLAIRHGVISGKFFPVMGGDSRTIIVTKLLDAVIDYLPNPLDLPPVQGLNPHPTQPETRKTDNAEPLSMLAFKIQTDPHVGRLTYLRIYSGVAQAGSSVLNATHQKSERLGRLLLMHADKREEIKQATAGEIIAAIGLKDTKTGDTLCDSTHPVILESISFPDPVISLAIEPKTKADQEKLGLALNKLSEEDPTFKIKTNHETGQTIISGMGELHLEIIVDRMKREFHVEANTGAPQVAYKETITGTAEGEGKYIRQTGGRGQYGHCFVRVAPKGRSEGFEFVNAIKGGAIPHNFIPSVEKGIKEALENGVLAGYPLVDLQVTLYDGTYHEVDSSDIAFKIAGSMALQAAVKKAHLVILEPVMKVEVTTPDEFLGEVIGDLSSKRAQIQKTDTRGNVKVISALVPLAELTGYATRLRSLTQGRASYYMEPSHYAEVPGNIAEGIISSSGKGKSPEEK